MPEIAAHDTQAHRDDQRGTGRNASRGPVHDVHHQVCSARVRQGVHPRVSHHRRRHVPLSQYRPMSRSAGVDAPDARANDARRPSVVAVVASAAVLGLIFVGLIRLLDPGINGSLFLLCLFLIVVTTAVVLNAITMDALNRTGSSDRY